MKCVYLDKDYLEQLIEALNQFLTNQTICGVTLGIDDERVMISPLVDIHEIHVRYLTPGPETDEAESKS